MAEEKKHKINVLRHRKSIMLTDAMKVVPYDFFAYDFDNDNDDDDDIIATNKKSASKKSKSSHAKTNMAKDHAPPSNTQYDDIISTTLTTEQQLPPEVTGYSEAEMQIIKQRAHEDGYQLAKHEAEQSLEKALLEKLSQLPIFIEKMQEQQQEYLAQSESQIISLTTMMMRKLFPAYMRVYGIDEIMHIIQESLPMLAHQNKLTITCHRDVEQIIAPMINELINAAHIDIYINYIHDDNMMLGDIALDWDSGGIENNMAATLDHMISAANKTIAQLDELRSQQNKQNEKQTIDSLEQKQNAMHDMPNEPISNTADLNEETISDHNNTIDDTTDDQGLTHDDDMLAGHDELLDDIDDDLNDLHDDDDNNNTENTNDHALTDHINHDDMPEDLDTDAL